MKTLFNIGVRSSSYQTGVLKALMKNEELKTLLEHLESHLFTRTYIVGEAVTLADVFVASSLVGFLFYF